MVGKDPAKTLLAQIRRQGFTTIQGAIDGRLRRYGSDQTRDLCRGFTISKKITLLGSGAGSEAGTILTEGTVSVAADGVTLDGIWFQQTYSEEDSKDQGACKLKTTETEQILPSKTALFSG